MRVRWTISHIDASDCNSGFTIVMVFGGDIISKQAGLLKITVKRLNSWEIANKNHTYTNISKPQTRRAQPRNLKMLRRVVVVVKVVSGSSIGSIHELSYTKQVCVCHRNWRCPLLHRHRAVFTRRSSKRAEIQRRPCSVHDDQNLPRWRPYSSHWPAATWYVVTRIACVVLLLLWISCLFAGMLECVLSLFYCSLQCFDAVGWTSGRASVL